MGHKLLVAVCLVWDQIIKHNGFMNVPITKELLRSYQAAYQNTFLTLDLCKMLYILTFFLYCYFYTFHFYTFHFYFIVIF